MTSVTLDSVFVRFPGGNLGLQDIDLRIDDGEFLALVGPSGSGKTTLLRSIAGFVEPASGHVLIGDRVVAGGKAFVPPEKRGLGMVFQQHAVWPHWTVGRNVEYPLKRAGIARDERRRRVSETLETVGLAGYDGRDPSTLSGGQRQRVALARAIVARPDVLLLDEALSALDEPLRDRLRLELHALTRELGLTVIHVTHDRAEALALADRVAVLDEGRIQQVGTPEELLAAPGSPFVAEFLSDATLVDGRVAEGVFGAGDHPLSVPCAVGVPDGDARAAIAPGAVRVVPDAVGDASIRSSLFTPSGSDLVVDWAGLRMRVHHTGPRLRAGERVRVEVERASVYPSVASAARSAERVSA
ncbi:ABC transporter ATP-binding protein [Microbacterium halophytorum]|uniref:ABC transporter ATP-binding protein n=1 Tax=Microbacterium halophytorum TaxID=2067568 RepID=UPI000CFCD338|nr:ABC transporter ATP-binding protein [Microbacterium halophytorum]